MEGSVDQSVLDARAKLAAKFGNVQIGGKGKLLSSAAAVCAVLVGMSRSD